MSDPSKTSGQMNFLDMPSATSLQASASGHMPCASPDGRMIDPSGQDLARASLSARQAKAQGLLTSGTSGPRSTTSSMSAALRLFLASKLRAKLALSGSTLYKLTWKDRVTPAQRSISALLASALHTKGSGSFSLERGSRTPISQRMGKPSAAIAGGLFSTDALATTGKCSATIAESGHTPSITNCPTMDANGAGVVPWATPSANEDAAGSLRGNMQEMLSHQVRGWIAESSELSEANYASLRVLMARWLMGLPVAWDACAPTATPSSRKSRKPSSKPTLVVETLEQLLT
jgi:hypothetical protein